MLRTSTRLPAESLQQSVVETVNSGRLGTIVSLRVLMSAEDDAVTQLGSWLSWIARLFGCKSGNVFAGRDAGGRQLSVLCSLESGATVSLTAVSYPRENEANTLQLLLIGQHGIARLEGGEKIDPQPSEDRGTSKWQSAIEQSLVGRYRVGVA